MKFFEDCRESKYRALQIYLILIGAASNGELLTYGVLAKRIRFGGPNILGVPLRMIHYWCEHNGVAPINTIVVRKDTGVPGDEIPPTMGQTINEVHQDVFETDWYAILPPEPADLERIYAEKRA